MYYNYERKFFYTKAHQEAFTIDQSKTVQCR